MVTANHLLRKAFGVLALAALLASLAGTAEGAPKPNGLKLSINPESVTGTELPCEPVRFDAIMTNTSDQPFFADATLSAEAPIKLSTEVYSSYLPATDPDQPVARSIGVSVPAGTEPGTYDITFASGKQRVVLPLTVTEVPVPGPGDNLAYGQLATASSTHGRFTACGAVDGNSNNADWSTRTGWNDADRSVFPDWLAVTWPEPVDLAKISVVTYGTPGQPATQGIKDFDVQVEVGDAWQTVCAVTDNLETTISCSFPSVSTESIRVFIHSSNSGDYSRLLEVEAYGAG